MYLVRLGASLGPVSHIANGVAYASASAPDHQRRVFDRRSRRLATKTTAIGIPESRPNPPTTMAGAAQAAASTDFDGWPEVRPEAGAVVDMVVLLLGFGAWRSVRNVTSGRAGPRRRP